MLGTEIIKMNNIVSPVSCHLALNNVSFFKWWKERSNQIVQCGQNHKDLNSPNLFLKLRYEKYSTVNER